MSAFVTGGSRGIGLALVQAILRENPGSRVVAAARTVSEPLEALKAQYSNRLLVVNLDLTEEASIQDATQATEDFCQGSLQLLVHNAGLMHPSGRGENSITRLDMNSFNKAIFHGTKAPGRKQGLELQTYPLQDNDGTSFCRCQVMATNVVGPALLTKALYPRLKSAGQKEPSKVVAVGAGVASISGNQAGGWYSYRTSKTAMNAFMKNLSIEGARHNVTAFSLYPQMVDTTLSKPYVKGNPYPELRSPEETAERMLELIHSFGMNDSGRFVNIWSRQDIAW
ncbi:unnamed protein product [Durusdinium trenchii]|uniref:NAD(P)-binding protein n=1 Tax=Durusdinium trenchii TaxID=1381693 RepID=A0ABP0RNF9_9DINO